MPPSQAVLGSEEALASVASLLDGAAEDLRSDLEGAVDQVKAAIQAATDVGPHR